MTKKFENLTAWKPKKLRILRNNLNNRMSSFASKGSDAKDLQKSNMLFGLSEEQCAELLAEVKAILKSQVVRSVSE
ncbi:MAG: hypothetical protein A2X86_13715 [Bdellovibrionales bacterium GWA2_49_15]|nr:MAG: hypothetical protein A2X86_13715 [Bdellovibrionales bacterium GWA2_49_15]HAZ13584.1 hypothetical protein [Bdellovibrionales bacterium]